MKLNIVLMIAGGLALIAGIFLTFLNNKNSDTDEVKEVKSSLQPGQIKHAEKSDSKTKGDNFEDYVANILKANDIRIKEWNKGTVTEQGAFGENALNPDMFLIDHTGSMDLEYWIECKFRSTIPEAGFELEQHQVDRYSEIQKDSKRKILIALGLGGSAEDPDRFFIIPLDSLKRFKHVPEKYITNYLISNPEKSLRGHIRNYFFNDVFKKSK